MGSFWLRSGWSSSVGNSSPGKGSSCSRSRPSRWSSASSGCSAPRTCSRTTANFCRAFPERPTAEVIAWFDDLIYEIRHADPATDELALDLPTRPHWRAKLLGTTVFFVSKGRSARGRAARLRPQPPTRERRAPAASAFTCTIHGRIFKPFEIDEASWANYRSGWPHAAPPKTIMIEVRDLAKTFPGGDGQPVAAVDGIRFTVRPGEVFGLLGPNGAGKTTTLRMLCTVLKPTGGTATVAGYDVVEQPSEVRRHVGFLSANTGVYDRMTAWEMVDYYGRLNQIPPDVLQPRHGRTVRHAADERLPRRARRQDEHRHEAEGVDRPGPGARSAGADLRRTDGGAGRAGAAGRAGKHQAASRPRQDDHLLDAHHARGRRSSATAWPSCPRARSWSAARSTTCDRCTTSRTWKSSSSRS